MPAAMTNQSTGTPVTQVNQRAPRNRSNANSRTICTAIISTMPSEA